MGRRTKGREPAQPLTHAEKWEQAHNASDFEPLHIETPPFRRDGDWIEPHTGVRFQVFRWLIGKPNAQPSRLSDDEDLAWSLFQYIVDVPLRGGEGDWAEIRRLYRLHVEDNDTLRRAATVSAIHAALSQFHGPRSKAAYSEPIGGLIPTALGGRFRADPGVDSEAPGGPFRGTRGPIPGHSGACSEAPGG